MFRFPFAIFLNFRRIAMFRFPPSVPVVFLLLLGWICHARAADGESARMTIPPISRSPVIDGAINEGEWLGAAKIQGFLINHHREGTLEPREGRTLVAYDRDNLYIAVSTELPPDGKLVAKIRRDMDKVNHDDAIEIWLDPNRGHRESGTGNLDLYQIIINSLGTKLDMVHAGDGLPNLAWSLEGHAFANKIDREKNRWEAEIAIPWKSVNANFADLDGKEIGLLVVRVWNRPYGQDPFSMGKAGAFAEWPNHPVFVLRKDAPLFREELPGNPFEAEFDYRLTIRNPSAEDRIFDVNARIDSNTMPTKAEEKRLAIAAGMEETFVFAPTSYHPGSLNTITAAVAATDGEILFRRELPVGRSRENRWEITGAEESTAFFIAYYPSMNKFGARLDFSLVENADRLTEAGIEIRDSEGKTLFTDTVAIDGKIIEKYFDIPDLPDGIYTARAILAEGKTVMEKPFERIHFPWEGNALGESDEILAPFEPVRTEGDQVNVVLRSHRMNGFGLWDSVTAKGRELLAAPMTLELETAAGREEWTAATVNLTEAKQNLAKYEARAESRAVIVNTISTIEEDGCMRVEMELSPSARPAEIAGLAVRIPMVDALAPLWHVIIGQGCRGNPVGTAPAGEGIVWDSTKTGNGMLLGTFLPYIWLGGPERGIAWFGNNDKDYAVDDARPVQILTRENGQLILTIHLINRPTKIDAPRKIVFGLQATPAKPRMDDWRRRGFNINRVHGGSNIYWTILQRFEGKYPAWRDWGMVDEMVRIRAAGRVDAEARAAFERWLDRVPPGMHERVRTPVLGGMSWVAGTGVNPQFIYYEGHGQDQLTEEWRVFQDEWGREQFTSRNWMTPTGAENDLQTGIFVHYNKSYADFSLYYGAMWMDRGFGLYSDNCYPVPSFNTLVSDAYVRDDGRTQPSVGIWEVREYYKRMWKLRHSRQPNTPYPLLQALHVTNTMWTPVVAWNDVNLDIEWTWDGGRGHFPADLILTQTTGLQGGNIGVVHHMLIPSGMYSKAREAEKENPERHQYLQRAEWGIRFVFELLRDRMYHWAINVSAEKLIRDFGYGEAGVEIINYWAVDERPEGAPEIACSDGDVKWIGLWKKGAGELLVALVNWSDARRAAGLAVKGAFGKIVNAETGGEMNTGDMALEPFELKIVHFSK